MGPETAFASGTFNPHEFKQSEYGGNAMEMQQIYNKYKDLPMHPEVLRYWEQKGAKKELFEGYSVFTPLGMTKDQVYPLIYCSHGGGDDIFLAETYGYSELVGPESLICVYAWNGDHANSQIEAEFPRVLNHLMANGYPIDPDRIYAVGFSAGSVASVRLAMTHPKMLAGVAPVPGANAFRGGQLAKKLADYAQTQGFQIPLICAGGAQDGGDCWPLEKEIYLDTFHAWMKGVAQSDTYQPLTLKASQTLTATSRDTVKKHFGLDFDRTWINHLEGTYWYGGDFCTGKGIPSARFISVDGLPHIHCRFLAVVIWNYLKQFSRNTETGELIFTNGEINHATTQ